MFNIPRESGLVKKTRLKNQKEKEKEKEKKITI
jgi:hypothetical protein